MPGPVSVTETCTSSSTRAAATVMLPPAGVNLTAFESRLKTTWRSRRSSPLDQVDVRCELERELDAVLDRAFTHHDDASFEGLAQREAGDLELDLPGLDLRQVEHVVDQREQVVARGQDVVEVLLLLLVDLAEHALPQHLREADDRVQRRPQLVRHVGEELALVPAGRLQLSVQSLQLLVHEVDVRRQRAELVSIRHIEPAGEVARGDLGEPRLRALDRTDQRPREDQPQTERQRDAHGTHADDQVTRGRVRAAVGCDQRSGLFRRSVRELVREREQVGVGVDRRLEERPRSFVGDARLVARPQRAHRSNDPVVVVPDLPEHSFVGRRRDELVESLGRVGGELRQRIENRRVEENPAMPSHALALRAGQRGRAGISRGPNPELLLQLVRLCLQRLVGGRSKLKRPQPLHPRVGLAEDAQPEHPDEHQERGDDQERDEQLRAHLRRHAGDRTHDSVVHACKRRPPSGGGRRLERFRPRHGPPSTTGSAPRSTRPSRRSATCR